MDQEHEHPVREFTPQDTFHPIDNAPRSSHGELPSVHHSGQEEMTTAGNDNAPEEHTGNNREVETQPEATLLLSGWGISNDRSAWFDASGFKSMRENSSPDFRHRVGLRHKGEMGEFVWIECTETDFRVYSSSGGRSRNDYEGLKGSGILATRAEGVIIPFGLVKPQSLEQLDLNIPPEFQTLDQLMKEYNELLERQAELQKTIEDIEAKWFGKRRSKEKKEELDSLQNQIQQKETDISKAQDALAKAEEKRPLNSYETEVTSLLLKAAQKPDSTIRGEILLKGGSFSALDWFKKLQELTKDKP